MQHAKITVADFPTKPGIYLMFNAAGVILYVGKARALQTRIASYFTNKHHSIKTQHLVAQIERIEVIVTNSEYEALLLENTFIKKHQPKYNILLRDDKTYPYVLMNTTHKYPRLSFYRGKAKPQLGRYFGPYTSSSLARSALDLAQQIFRLRSCDDNTFAQRLRPCLQYQIKRCSAPCVNFITLDAYQEDVQRASWLLQGQVKPAMASLELAMQHAVSNLNFEMAAILRDQIKMLTNLAQQSLISERPEDVDIIVVATQHGVCCVYIMQVRAGLLHDQHTHIVAADANEELTQIIPAVLGQRYLLESESSLPIPPRIIVSTPLAERALLERALTHRYKLGQGKGKVKLISKPSGHDQELLGMAQQNATIQLDKYLAKKLQLVRRFADLTQLLKLEAVPQCLACIDVSHNQGESTVASCVVFNQEGPYYQAYRRFHITDITPGDDLAAICQVVERYFSKAHPADQVDLLIIDGGPGQLSAALTGLANLGKLTPAVISIAKGPGRKPGLETMYLTPNTTLKLAPDAPGFYLLQHIRDEAHRFAITGQRKHFINTRSRSSLTTIPGVGPTKARALLQHFGSLSKVLQADPSQLMAVPGITPQLAAAITQYAQHVAD